MLADEPGIRVPTAVPELTTKRLLTMSWLNGRSIQSRIEEDPTQEERDAYARVLFRAWYVPFYRYGVIHGDPHLGNYQVRPEDRGLNLLDFGTIRVFKPSFVSAVVRLYRAVRDGDDDAAAHAFEAWGFRNLSRETMDVLMKWARFLHEPVLDDRVRPISESSDPMFGRKVAEEVHAGLKKTGGVKPPREFVLMDRATVGLGSVFLRLKARQNWHRLFEELIDGYDEDALAARQAEALQRAGVPQEGV